MSYMVPREVMEKRRKKREQELMTQIRMLLEQQKGQLTPFYDIANSINSVREQALEAKELSALLDKTPDVYREPTTGLYYLAPKDWCASFQKKLKGNLEISGRDKVKQVLKTIFPLLMEASKRGEHEVVLLELSCAEYKAAAIEEAVGNVVSRLYGSKVFVRKELNKTKLVQSSNSTLGFLYEEHFFLCAQLLTTATTAHWSNYSHQQEQCADLAHFYKLKECTRLFPVTTQASIDDTTLTPPPPPSPVLVKKQKGEEEEEEEGVLTENASTDEDTSDPDSVPQQSLLATTAS